MDEDAPGPEPSSESFLNSVPPPPTPPPAPPPAPKHGLRWVFVGQSGIRAGWGILLFIVVFAATALAITFAMRAFFQHRMHAAAMTPASGLTAEGVQLLCVVIATGLLAIIERKSLFAYGYQGKARTTRFVSGLVWGFIAISALVFALWKLGYLAFDGQPLHGAAMLKYAAAWGLMFLLVGLFEESTLRGYLQYTMTRGIGFWWGALVFSLLFGLGHTHNTGESPVGLFSAGAIGLVFCLSIWYTGSLWWAVGFHAAWDWGESYFYGTADSGLIVKGHLFGEHPLGKLLWSGGKTGPEGSILIVPLLIIIAILMWLWWGHRTQSPFKGQAWRPAWSRRPCVTESSGIEPIA
ncbi:MAG: CPBP family intramembrane glutamic endopeptidase [Acidobacteriaceae bacterium]